MSAPTSNRRRRSPRPNGRPSSSTRPAVRVDEAREDPHRRGLAGAVGAQEPVHDARRAPAGRARRGPPAARTLREALRREGHPRTVRHVVSRCDREAPADPPARAPRSGATIAPTAHGAVRHGGPRSDAVWHTRPDPQVDHPTADRPNNRRAVTTAGILSHLSGGSPPGTRDRPSDRPGSALRDGCPCPAAPSSRRRRLTIPTVTTAPCRGVPAERRHDDCPSTRTRRPAGVAQEDPVAVDRGLRRTASSRPRRPPRPRRPRQRPRKVVIVVGPVGGATANYRTAPTSSPTRLAATAHRSPRSTAPTPRGRASVTPSSGANVLIYLGHGNGWPSPYYPFSTTSQERHGPQRHRVATGTPTRSTTASTTWPGWTWPTNAVVVLNRLCYASGNNEWGASNPTKVHRDQARRQLRVRLPQGRCQGGLRERHHERRAT